MLDSSADQRPTSSEVLAGLQDTARRIGQTVYFPSEVVESTRDNQHIFWHSWAVAYQHFGQYTEALAKENRGIAVDPGHLYGYESRGNIHQLTNQLDLALADYDRALTAYRERMPDNPAQKVVWAMRGACLRKMGRYAEAEESYARSVQFDPEHAVVWYNRAINQRAWSQAEAQAGQMTSAKMHADLAITYTQRAIAIHPKHQGYHDNLAIQQRWRASLGS